MASYLPSRPTLSEPLQSGRLLFPEFLPPLQSSTAKQRPVSPWGTFQFQSITLTIVNQSSVEAMTLTRIIKVKLEWSGGFPVHLVSFTDRVGSDTSGMLAYSRGMISATDEQRLASAM